MPTWDSVTFWGRREQWLVDRMQVGYPRWVYLPTFSSIAYDSTALVNKIERYADLPPIHCRFYIHKTVEKLNVAVLERLFGSPDPENIGCMIFPCDDATRCLSKIKKEKGPEKIHGSARFSCSRGFPRQKKKPIGPVSTQCYITRTSGQRCLNSGCISATAFRVDMRNSALNALALWTLSLRIMVSSKQPLRSPS